MFGFGLGSAIGSGMAGGGSTVPANAITEDNGTPITEDSGAYITGD